MFLQKSPHNTLASMILTNGFLVTLLLPLLLVHPSSLVRDEIGVSPPLNLLTACLVLYTPEEGLS